VFFSLRTIEQKIKEIDKKWSLFVMILWLLPLGTLLVLLFLFVLKQNKKTTPKNVSKII